MLLGNHITGRGVGGDVRRNNRECSKGMMSHQLKIIGLCTCGHGTSVNLCAFKY